MTKKAKPIALLCYRVGDVPGFPAALSRIDTCSRCDQAVWRALSSPQHIPALCFACVKGEKFEIEAPTKRQLKDIAKYWGPKAARS